MTVTGQTTGSNGQTTVSGQTTTTSVSGQSTTAGTTANTNGVSGQTVTTTTSGPVGHGAFVVGTQTNTVTDPTLNLVPATKVVDLNLVPATKIVDSTALVSATQTGTTPNFTDSGLVKILLAS